jgi:hypothetical protein
MSTINQYTLLAQPNGASISIIAAGVDEASVKAGVLYLSPWLGELTVAKVESFFIEDHAVRMPIVKKDSFSRRLPSSKQSIEDMIINGLANL